MIEHFYANGFVTAVTQQTQTLYCYSCDKDGINHWGDECSRCSGTHIYRQYQLYKFTLNVNGKRFAWHQPTKVFALPVVLTDDTVTEFEFRPLPVDSCPTESLLDLYLMTAWVYLERQHRFVGIHPRLRMNLGNALREDINSYTLTHMWWRTRLKFRFATRRLRSPRLKKTLWKMREIATEANQGMADDDDIPF